MVGISEELKTLDLTDIAGTCSYPTLLICGSKDKPNLSSMRSLHKLILESQFQIIPDGPLFFKYPFGKQFKYQQLKIK